MKKLFWDEPVLVVVLLLALGCGSGDSEPGVGDAEGGGSPPSTTTPAGQILFVNSCEVPLALVSNGAHWADLHEMGGHAELSIASLRRGTANVVMPYPNLRDEQCPAGYCDGWTALGGVPGTTQREGWMWEGTNETFAAYCNPNLSGRGICAVQKNCCGVGMVQDGTFGTTWEITPNGGDSQNQDFIDLSTNYGSGPSSPPNLCPYRADPNDCVSEAANIFYNVPVRWSSNVTCSCTSEDLQVKSRQCLEVSCPEAYQHPVDNKQCACPSDEGRGYRVEFCPAGSRLPPVPS